MCGVFYVIDCLKSFVKAPQFSKMMIFINLFFKRVFMCKCIYSGSQEMLEFHWEGYWHL